MRNSLNVKYCAENVINVRLMIVEKIHIVISFLNMALGQCVVIIVVAAMRVRHGGLAICVVIGLVKSSSTRENG